MRSPRRLRVLTRPTESHALPGWPWVSLPALLFLIVLSSTVAVDAVDWACRMATEPGELP